MHYVIFSEVNHREAYQYVLFVMIALVFRYVITSKVRFSLPSLVYSEIFFIRYDFVFLNHVLRFTEYALSYLFFVISSNLRTKSKADCTLADSGFFFVGERSY